MLANDCHRVAHTPEGINDEYFGPAPEVLRPIVFLCTTRPLVADFLDVGGGRPEFQWW